MTLHEYQASIQLMKEDPPFYALIMAAMRDADTDNLTKLVQAFPDTWLELSHRYSALGGFLPGDQIVMPSAMRATRIGLVNPEARGEQVLWRLSHEIDFRNGKGKTNYVVTSAVTAFSDGPETYVFPANKKGVVIDWGELSGSFRGALDHQRAINGLLGAA